MSKGKNTIRLTAITAVVGLFAGLFGGIISNEYFVAYIFDRASGGEAEQMVKKVVEERTYVEESAGIDAINKVGDAVVSIVATRDLKVYRRGAMPFDNYYFDPFGGVMIDPRGGFQNDVQPEEILKQKLGGGTGFIITNDGLILTNRHVVEDRNAEYTVVMRDGTEFASEVISIDPFYDIAVVRMKVAEDDPDKEKKEGMFGKLKVMEFGDSDELKVGQRVLAIGNALAEYENTVTSGIVSAKGRDIVAGGVGSRSEQLSGLIQTDAAINPGNSGGPLINLKGQVVGVNVAIDQIARSVGFAIPINDVKPILASVEKYGKIVRPVLGVRYMLLTPEQANELQIDVEQGALLVGDEDQGRFPVLPGGPADKAGLRKADVILELDGREVNIDNPLLKMIQSKQPGDKVKLKVWRSGEEIEVEVELGKEEGNGN